MDCPRCSEREVIGPDCPRCGVVFAKLARPRVDPAPPRVLSPPPLHRSSGAGGLLKILAFCLALLGAGALAARLYLGPRLRSATASISTGPEAHAPASDRDVPPPILRLPTPSAAVPPVVPGRIPEADRVLARSLSEKIAQRLPLSAGDLRAAEDLFSRYPGEEPVRDLLVALLLSASDQAHQERRLAEALEHARRAVAVSPQLVRNRVVLLGLLLEASDWARAEAAAREILALDAREADALEGLAFALFRQDRNREAVEALNEAMEVRPSASARSLLERIQKNLGDEKGMTERQLSHFHVRYDGESHEDVGREILRMLERHYATLAATLDHQPEATIPVILFARERYYDASGAPAWSGGVFDNIDGRIRIPIGGLDPRLTSDIDGVLIHELTHAFIHDLSRGLAPREVHEGLAQYMEGKRVSSLLTQEQLTALADGRLGGVGGYYLGALSLVEFLMAGRGQGGMNDLLRTMGEKGDVNEGFRDVYGYDYAGAKKAWMDRLKQQYGS